MGFKGTKGKWLAKYTSGFLTIVSKETERDVLKNAILRKELEANAVLLSKAPEMLEMLKKVNDLINMSRFPTEKEMIEYSDKIEQLIEEAIKPMFISRNFLTEKDYQSLKDKIHPKDKSKTFRKQ